MAQISQLGAIGVPGGDITVKNYSGSDIGAKLAVIRDTTNTPGPHGLNPLGVTLPASDTKPFGIALTTIPTLKFGQVRCMGTAVGVASGTIHVGDALMTDSAGKVLPQTAGKMVIGFAESEAASTEDVLVRLSPSVNA